MSGKRRANMQHLHEMFTMYCSLNAIHFIQRNGITGGWCVYEWLGLDNKNNACFIKMLKKIIYKNNLIFHKCQMKVHFPIRVIIIIEVFEV